MIDFIIKFEILNFDQIGFIPDHNTSDALLAFLDNEYEAMNKNKMLLPIFPKPLTQSITEYYCVN